MIHKIQHTYSQGSARNHTDVNWHLQKSVCTQALAAYTHVHHVPTHAYTQDCHAHTNVVVWALADHVRLSGLAISCTTKQDEPEAGMHQHAKTQQGQAYWLAIGSQNSG